MTVTQTTRAAASRTVSHWVPLGPVKKKASG